MTWGAGILLGVLGLATPWPHVGAASARSASSRADRIPICVCICPSDRYPREKRPHVLAGLRRALDLDTLLLEAPGASDSIVLAGSMSNRYRLVGLDFVPECETCERYVTAVRHDALLPERKTEDCRQSIRVTLDWGSRRPMGGYGPRPRLAGVTHDDWATLSVTWRGRMLGSGAPPDSELAIDVVTFPQRSATRERLEQIRGWMMGMNLLQGLHRADGYLPDSLDLVFDSLGRNKDRSSSAPAGAPKDPHAP